MVAAAPRILVEGHRGARAMMPENTLPAFEYAIRIGADFLELDLAVTRDGVLVVSHDPVVNRKICAGPEGETTIHKMTLAEVRAFDCGAIQNPEFPRQKRVPGTRIPTFDEVLALAPKGTFHFNVELKIDPKKPELAPAPEEFARMAIAAIRKAKLEQRVVVQSFDFRSLRAMKAQAPDIELAALYSGAKKDFVEISREAAGAKTVSPQFSLVTPEQVEVAHKAGLRVVPWTPNQAEYWDKLIAAGVDAIITDDPAALIEYLKLKGLR
jgi:glycerophosphoryl diester phosphodiesterase